jgi:hypothetical protein
MKARRGSVGMAPLILKPGTIWRRVINFTPWALYLGKEPRHPLNTRTGGPQSRSERFGEEKNPSHLS